MSFISSLNKLEQKSEKAAHLAALFTEMTFNYIMKAIMACCSQLPGVKLVLMH